MICPKSSHGREGVGIRRAEVHKRGSRVGMVAKDLRANRGSTGSVGHVERASICPAEPIRTTGCDSAFSSDAANHESKLLDICQLHGFVGGPCAARYPLFMSNDCVYVGTS